MTGIRIGRLVECGCNMVFAIIVAMIYGWKLALVMLLCFPLLALGALLEFTLLQSGSGDGPTSFASENEEEAMAIAAESVESIRTISSLTLERNREADFKSHLSLGEFGLKIYFR